MKKILLFLIFTQSVFSQKFITRNGLTEFKASVQAFEPVEAKNNSTTAILTKEGKIATQLFISAFKFKVALMQEHFNENYMDSDQFPKATFNGEITNFNVDEINTEKAYAVKGILTIKGIAKEINFNAKINNRNNSISLNAKFSVLASDFNIEIPNIVRKKISKNINILINYDFTEKR